MEFLFKGKKYSKESFMSEFNVAEEDFMTIYEHALKSGAAYPISEETQNMRQKAFDDLISEINVSREAEYIRQNEKTCEENERSQKNEYVPKYGSVAFVFNNIYEANRFANESIHELAISESDISIDMENKVHIKNITETEFKKLSFKYNGMKAKKKIVCGTNKAAYSASKIVDNLAREVAVPIGTTAIRAGSNIVKTLFTSGAKLIGSTVSTVKEAAKETAYEMQNDTTIIKGKADFNDAKNGIKKKLDKFGANTFSNGISIEQ